MKNIAILIGLAIALAGVSGCKPAGSSVTPEGAQQMLHIRGYEINAKGYYKAIQMEDHTAIRTFYQADVDLNMQNEKGENPLTYAVLHCEPKTVAVLLEKVDINRRDKTGNTALYLSLLRRRKEMFDLLMKNNPDVNVPGEDNNTVLHLATTHDNFDLIKRLVDCGANVNAVDGIAQSIPMTEACVTFGGRSNIETVKFYIEKGADVNNQSATGRTCLMIASDEGQDDLVGELLNVGAKTDLKDKDGKTALDLARAKKRDKVVKLLTAK